MDFCQKRREGGRVEIKKITPRPVLRLSSAPPTPAQAQAWAKLWAKLLVPAPATKGGGE